MGERWCGLARKRERTTNVKHKLGAPRVGFWQGHGLLERTLHPIPPRYIQIEYMHISNNSSSSNSQSGGTGRRTAGQKQPLSRARPGAEDGGSREALAGDCSYRRAWLWSARPAASSSPCTSSLPRPRSAGRTERGANRLITFTQNELDESSAIPGFADTVRTMPRAVSG